MTAPKRVRLAAVLTLILVVWAGGVSAQERLRFTTADNQEHPRAQFVNDVLTTCFARLGIAIDFDLMPSKRSLQEANKGLADGNFLRTSELGAAYPQLVLVPEPLEKNWIVAFSKDTTLPVDGWESLLPYDVVFIRGWRNCERELKDAKSTTRVRDERLLFNLLHKGRADVGVYGLETGMQALAKMGITDVAPLSPPVAISDLFLYVHQKHAALVPLIAQTLREMKRDGTFGAIQARYGRFSQ